MINVSNTWKSAVREQFRLQAYLHASLQVVPPELAYGVTVATDDSFEQSDPSTITDTYTEVAHKYATLEPNRWILDGSMEILGPDTATDQWWANKSNPDLVLTFSSAQDLIGLTINWDIESESWPSSFTVKGYNSGSVLYTYNLSASAVKEYYAAAMEGVDKIELKVNTWALPNWRARILEIIFGLWIEWDSINNGRIRSATLTDGANPLAEEQPTHTFKIVLDNTDLFFDPQLINGASKYIAQKQHFKIWWRFYTSPGVLETTPETRYILDSFNIPADSLEVDMSFTSRLALLTKEFTLGNYTGSARTFASIATYILNNGGVMYDEAGVDPWVLSSKLSDYSTTAPIPSLPVNSLLQLIALACCCYLKVRSEDDYIVFLNNTEDVPVQSLTMNQELGNPEAEVIDRLRSISIALYSYTVSLTSTEVGRGEYNLDAQTEVTLQYSAEYAHNVSASITGGTIISSQFYAAHAVLVLSAGSNIVVTLTGYEIKVAKSFVETYKDPLVSSGLDVSIDNPFITDSTQLQDVSDYVKRYYQRRTRYRAPYLGYPELEAADVISTETIFGEAEADVVKNTIDFNGGWTGIVETI